ncbi:Ubiquinone/menaquinone biosynthesis C-methylase UbiE [Halobacillus alkaliphilus]|uniref:Ubiquinone/menaquinone biosynthesis C-methylase UbiE n=1 Tax=Halobacillus alkaliphilus TaxID=396056 RepID=A0A1I2M5C9_9BACI|nr:class I SAM-dependent methyltransferase [Halobacillus alkaliphilus]SFF86019.1 Ubiquinone/menaquinone biosynthesis C-methylase UbiE [Halobacillus alkaliphilus]
MDINRQIKLFEKQAEKYAKRARKQTADHKWRRKLLHSARGNILEISVGAGTNFQYYPEDAEVTAVDFSPTMIEQAKGAAAEQTLKVDFMVENVEELDLPSRSFDTVVSTLSMCSYPNPEKVLEKLGTLCKEEGQILLLEHGVSTNRLVSSLQHLMDPLVKKRIGCHVNRDMLKLFDESPLEIKRVESSLLNSIHLVWARPSES